MGNDTRKSALFQILHASGREGKDVRVCVRAGERIIGTGEKLNRFFFVVSGTVMNGTNPFGCYVIGAKSFFTNMPSKVTYTALTDVDVFIIDSPLVIAKHESAKGLPLFRALLNDSDISEDLKRALLVRCGLDPRNEELVTKEIEAIAKSQGAEQEYERVATDILMELLRKRAQATGLNASMAFIPNLDSAH